MPAPTLPSENPAGAVASPSGYALEFDNVSIAFDEKVVLDGVSFQLPHGETKALFGVAGSGKSVLLKLAIGLLRPDSGRISVLEEEAKPGQTAAPASAAGFDYQKEADRIVLGKYTPPGVVVNEHLDILQLDRKRVV